MIPYDIDPSLHNNQPGSQRLHDGFSTPRRDDEALSEVDERSDAISKPELKPFYDGAARS